MKVSVPIAHVFIMDDLVSVATHYYYYASRYYIIYLYIFQGFFTVLIRQDTRIMHMQQNIKHIGTYKWGKNEAQQLKMNTKHSECLASALFQSCHGTKLQMTTCSLTISLR
jgi:hypothetical protein